MDYNMIIDTEGKPKDRKIDKIYEMIISASDYIGSIIYKDRNITKEEIIKKIFTKKEKKKSISKQSHTINIFEIILSLFKKDKNIKKMDKKRTAGLIVVISGILLSIMLIIYILNIIITAILDIMEWWVLALIVLIFAVPVAFAIAFITAADDY